MPRNKKRFIPHNLRLPDPDGILAYNSVTDLGTFMLISSSKFGTFDQTLSAGDGYAQAAAASRFS